MKKRFLLSKLKVLCSITLCVLLLGSNFVWADSPYIFVPYNSTYNNTDTIKNNGVEFAPNSFAIENTSNDGADVYFFRIGNYIHGISTESVSIYFAVRTAASSWDWWSFSPSTLDTNSGLYYSVNGGSIPSYSLNHDLTDFPVYSNMQDALNYVLNYSEDPLPVGNFDLQVGNITFIDLGSSGASYDLTLKSYFNKLSGTLSGGWEYDNRRYGFSSELPTTSFSVDSSSGSGFNWTKTDPKNLIGRSHYGLSEISGNSTGRYLWIVNPLYNENYYNDSLSGDSINGRINVSGLPAGSTFYTYPLVQSATSLSLASDVATTSGGTGTVSETGGNTPTVSIDDPDSSYSQPIGGDNSPPEEVTLQEGVNQLFQTLKDFTEKVINLLSAPADFIQQLISAGQSFTQAIASMFTWLPQSIQDVLIAALGVMIVVGFLKLLF